jgi:hypothetical protein
MDLTELMLIMHKIHLVAAHWFLELMAALM